MPLHVNPMVRRKILQKYAKIVQDITWKSSSQITITSRKQLRQLEAVTGEDRTPWREVSRIKDSNFKSLAQALAIKRNFWAEILTSGKNRMEKIRAQ